MTVIIKIFKNNWWISGYVDLPPMLSQDFGSLHLKLYIFTEWTSHGWKYTNKRVPQ